MELLSEISNSWGWTGIVPQKIVGENDFGNLIIQDIDGMYWRLCPEDSYCKVIAKDRDKLDILSKDQKFLADWNVTNLVDIAKNGVGSLEEGWKYCLVIPSVLGGSYDASNLKSVPLVELIGSSGDIARKIHTLADGEQIKLKVT